MARSPVQQRDDGQKEVVLIELERPARVPDDKTQDLDDAARAAGGDVAAFERLYRRHSPRIYGLCCRMLGEPDAEDALQDVFVRAWRKLALFRGDAAFGTWLYRVAINHLLGRRAARASRPELNATNAVERLPASGPRDRVDLRVDFERAIRRLPEGARAVFILHDVEGYTHEEIGEMLRVKPGTSKSQLHRARMTLRQYLR